MAIFTPGKKVSFRELKQSTKGKSWLSKTDRLSLLKEAKKYQSGGGISKWEIRKKILPSLKQGEKDTIKRWEVPRIKKGLLEK